MSDPKGCRPRISPPTTKPRLREIEVLIISAEGLKNVKHATKMRTHAQVYVEKDRHVATTHLDEKGGTNPTWKDIVKVKFREDPRESDVIAALNVDIYARGRVREKPVGSARVLLCDVLKGGDAADPAENPVQVWRRSGRPQGLLNLWVPPTGRFLIRRVSLSFSVKETAEETVVIGGGAGEEVVMVKTDQE
ncbi:BON1-associated protein 2 [Morus notabilis]|uniref:BON1-associated protein 2 n=1 Tax=Morus notabilis TaxID=981085 RepID=W9SES6_9ROSA|nr:BON1-associated protein 2 [Morus notabilis]